MKKSVVSNSIVFILTLLLLRISWLFIILNLILLAIIVASYMTKNTNSKWIFGFLLISNSKRVYTDYGDNFWVTILKDKSIYRAYLIEDRMFYCRVIGNCIDYYGNIDDLKNKVGRILDRHYAESNREREDERIASENFKNWDGCLSKECSRDKKISKIC